MIRICSCVAVCKCHWFLRINHNLAGAYIFKKKFSSPPPLQTTISFLNPKPILFPHQIFIHAKYCTTANSLPLSPLFSLFFHFSPWFSPFPPLYPLFPYFSPFFLAFPLFPYLQIRSKIEKTRGKYHPLWGKRVKLCSVPIVFKVGWYCMNR